MWDNRTWYYLSVFNLDSKWTVLNVSASQHECNLKCADFTNAITNLIRTTLITTAAAIQTTNVKWPGQRHTHINITTNMHDFIVDIDVVGFMHV